MRHLLDGERAQLNTARKRDGFKAAHNALPPLSEFVAAALAGSSKHGWYANAKVAIEARYGNDSATFTGLLAALSPRVSLEANIKNTIAAFDMWVSRGRPAEKNAIVWNVLRVAIPGELMGAWIPNAVASLNQVSPQLSGSKVSSFYKNLRGDLSAVTCDAWIATFSGVDPTKLGGWKTTKGFSKSLAYLALSSRIRAAAKALGWQPAEIQECIWAFTKTAWEKASSEGCTVLSLVKAESLTAAIIGATPDIHTLLSSNASKGSTMGLPKQGPLMKIAKRLDLKLAAARQSGQEPNF